MNILELIYFDVIMRQLIAQNMSLCYDDKTRNFQAQKLSVCSLLSWANSNFRCAKYLCHLGLNILYIPIHKNRILPVFRWTRNRPTFNRLFSSSKKKTAKRLRYPVNPQQTCLQSTNEQTNSKQAQCLGCQKKQEIQ